MHKHQVQNSEFITHQKPGQGISTENRPGRRYTCYSSLNKLQQKDNHNHLIIYMNSLNPWGPTLLGVQACVCHLDGRWLGALQAWRPALGKVIDGRSAANGLAQIQILPQGNCSFLWKSISIFHKGDPAKFMHEAGTQSRNLMNCTHVGRGMGETY